jgi:hypothetical protein
VELKEELAKRGLKAVGKKANLVALLEEDDRSSGGGTTSNVTEAPSKSPKKEVKAKAPSTPTRTKKAKQPPSPKAKKSPTKKKAADHQRITDVDELPKLWNEDMAKANGSYSKCVMFRKFVACFAFR